MDFTPYFLDVALGAAVVGGVVALLREAFPALRNLSDALVRLFAVLVGVVLAALGYILGWTPLEWSLPYALGYGVACGVGSFLGVDFLRSGSGYQQKKQLAQAVALAQVNLNVWETVAGKYVLSLLKRWLPESLLPLAMAAVQGVVADYMGQAWNSSAASAVQAKVRSILISLGLMQANEHGPRHG